MMRKGKDTMKKRRFAMVLAISRCIDCKACTVACKTENRVPHGQDNYRNWVSEGPLRGTFPNLGQSFIPGQCMQCANTPCDHVCPTGATQVTADGIVIVEDKKCIGCKYCMTACPYNARYFNEATGAVDKCTFCIQRIYQGRQPACVDTCPTKVRVFGDLNDPNSAVSKLLVKNPYRIEKPEMGTEPYLFYLI